MEPEVAERLRALEERIAELERRAGTAHAAARPGTPPPETAAAVAARLAARRSAPPTEPGPRRARRSLEDVLGGTVLARLGAGALFLAAVYFAQLGWRYLGPTAKVLGIYALGAVLLALGAWLRPRVTQRYVAILWGAAVADVYLAGVVAKLAYDLVSTPLAFALLVGASALGQALASILRVEALATVALAGAATAPLLSGGDATTPTLLLVYLLAVHCWSAGLQARYGWHWARGVGFAGGAAVACLWYASHWRDGDLSLVLHAQAFQLGLVAPELIAAFRRRPIGRERELLLGITATLLTLGLAVHTIVVRALPAHPLASGAAWLALALALAPRAAGLARDLARLGGVLIPLGLVVLWPRVFDPSPATNDVLRALALLGATAALLTLRARVGVGDLGATFAALLAVWVMPESDVPYVGVPVALAAVALILDQGRPAVTRIVATLLGTAAAALAVESHAPRGHGGHVVAAAAFAWLAACGLRAALRSDRALARTAIVAVSMGTAWWTLAAIAEIVDGPRLRPAPLWNAHGLALSAILAAAWSTTRSAATDITWRAWPAATALAALYAFGLGEVTGAVHDADHAGRAVATSLYSTLFAAGVLGLGFQRRSQALRLTALVAFVLIAIKVGLYDLAAAPTPLRVLVTGGLGAVLLTAAWAYARRRA